MSQHVDQLEATIAEGLSRFGDVCHELARWVVTGIPDKIDVSDVQIVAVTPRFPEQLAAMMAAGRSADPIVEWRLGELIYRLDWGRRPPGVLDVLRELNRLRSPDERVAALLEASKTDEREFLRSLLELPSYRESERELWRGATFARLVFDHPDIVSDKLAGSVETVETVTDALGHAPGYVCVPLAPAIADLAVSASKKRRAAGIRLGLAAGYEAMAPQFETRVVDGGATARAEAIRAWTTIAGDEHRGDVLAFCQQHCAADRSAAVREAVAELTRLGAASPPQTEWPVIDESPPTDAEHAAFWDIAAAPAGTIDEAAWKRIVEGAWTYVTTGDHSALVYSLVPMPRDRVAALAAALRPLYVFRLIRVVSGRWPWSAMIGVISDRNRTTGSPSLLDVQAAAERAGFERHEVIRRLLDGLRWDPDSIATWAWAVQDDLMSALKTEEVNHPTALTGYYDALGSLSPMPSHVRQYLIAQAVGDRKGVRPLARAALRGEPELVETVTELLSSRKYEERAQAAHWLGELAASEATPALHRAASTETNNDALGAELGALEKLGESIDPYLEPERLIEQGAKDLTRGMPADSSWVVVDHFPELRWRDGNVVDRRLVEWLLVQAVRLKSPTPSPIVSRLFDRMDAASTTRFGNGVFAAWTAKDLETLSPAEIDARVAQVRHLCATDPRYANDDPDELASMVVSHASTQPIGSAIASKGLLSLAAAGADQTVVAPTESYLRRWYGLRAGQSKALVEMLGSIDEPAAVQLLLSIGNRFRTKGIQQAAIHQAELVADRKGWTLADLEYRSVPTGGFAADGTLTLDYGDRTFDARLTDDLKIVLSDADGQTIKALPAARQREDPEVVKLAKRELADAKKQIVSAAKTQPLRLHDAMCEQRQFGLEDFDRYVLGHPVVGRLATRLVWAAVSGADRVLFRPLTDGTLLDDDDDEIDISSADFVTLAHEVIDGATLGERWLTHLAEYKVTPLFAQFDRPKLPTLTDGQNELTDWRGAIIDDRRLRSVGNRLGFAVGPSNEDGVAFTVERRFVGAGLVGQLSVHGLYATIVETDVAIDSLSFARLGDTTPIPLGDVPPVLLVETIADVEQIADAGDGIDPDWESRIYG